MSFKHLYPWMKKSLTGIFTICGRQYSHRRRKSWYSKDVCENSVSFRYSNRRRLVLINNLMYYFTSDSEAWIKANIGDIARGWIMNNNVDTFILYLLSFCEREHLFLCYYGDPRHSIEPSLYAALLECSLSASNWVHRQFQRPASYIP